MRLLPLLPLVTVAACKHEPPPAAELVDINKLCTDHAYDEQGEAKKRVTVEGYLDISRAMVTLCSQYTCDAELRSGPGSDARRVDLSINLGDDPGEMKKYPDGFTEKDLVVHATGGKVVGAGAKVRVTGQRLGSAAGACSLVKIDRIDAM